MTLNLSGTPTFDPTLIQSFEDLPTLAQKNIDDVAESDKEAITGASAASIVNVADAQEPLASEQYVSEQFGC